METSIIHRSVRACTRSLAERCVRAANVRFDVWGTAARSVRRWSELLTDAGHQTVAASRKRGTNVFTGEGWPMPR